MLDKIIISQDRHDALIVFETHSFSVHSDGNVLDLLTWLVFARGTQVETYSQWTSSHEDTQKIDLSELEKQAA